MTIWRAIAAATLLATAPVLLAGEIPPDARRSGYSFMGPDTRAMQDDDTSNPGMLFVLDGEALWTKKAGSAGKACADCHGDARSSMKGVAARYPAFDKGLARPVTLDQRINSCRVNHQQATALPTKAATSWRCPPSSPTSPAASRSPPAMIRS